MAAAAALLLLVGLAWPTVAEARTACEARKGGTAYWSWRIVDGRRCWYLGRRGRGKAGLYWPAPVLRPPAPPPLPRQRPGPPAPLMFAGPRDEVPGDLSTELTDRGLPPAVVFAAWPVIPPPAADYVLPGDMPVVEEVPPGIADHLIEALLERPWPELEPLPVKAVRTVNYRAPIVPPQERPPPQLWWLALMPARKERQI